MVALYLIILAMAWMLKAALLIMGACLYSMIWVTQVIVNIVREFTKEKTA